MDSSRKFKVGDRVIYNGTGGYIKEVSGKPVDFGTVAYVGDRVVRVYFDGVESGELNCRLDEITLVESNEGTIKDNVNSPSHYGNGSIECIDYIKDSLNDDEYQGYLRGNIAKYLHRFPYKNGVEDLKKAQVYLGWLIEHVEGKAT